MWAVKNSRLNEDGKVFSGVARRGRPPLDDPRAEVAAGGADVHYAAEAEAAHEPAGDAHSLSDGTLTFASTTIHTTTAIQRKRCCL